MITLRFRLFFKGVLALEWTLLKMFLLVRKTYQFTRELYPQLIKCLVQSDPFIHLPDTNFVLRLDCMTKIKSYLAKSSLWRPHQGGKTLETSQTDYCIFILFYFNLHHQLKIKASGERSNMFCSRECAATSV